MCIICKETCRHENIKVPINSLLRALTVTTEENSLIPRHLQLISKEI